MQIIGVVPFAYRNYIQFEGLDALKDALRLFASGRTKGSQATTNKLSSDMGGLGGVMAVAMKGMIDDDSSFLRGLFAEIDARFAPQGRKKKMPPVGTSLSKSYDYDGPGPFFKSGVKVAYAGDNVFLLDLHAAYVGNEVEIGLAAALEVERCLMRTGVKLEIKPTGEMFNFDLEAIAQGLVAAGLDLPEHFQHIDGGTIRTIMQTANEGSRHGETSDAILSAGDNYQLKVGLTNVDSPWVFDGSTVSGPLRNVNKYTDKPLEWGTPAILLTFEGRRETDTDWNRLPVTDVALATKLTEMASAVEGSFK